MKIWQIEEKHEVFQSSNKTDLVNFFHQILLIIDKKN